MVTGRHGIASLLIYLLGWAWGATLDNRGRVAMASLRPADNQRNVHQHNTMSASDYSELIAVRQENRELRELITQLYKIIIKSVVDDKEAQATLGRGVRQTLTSRGLGC